MKKLFITAYMLIYGVDRAEAVEAYRTANQAYRILIVKKFKEAAYAD